MKTLASSWFMVSYFPMPLFSNFLVSFFLDEARFTLEEAHLIINIYGDQISEVGGN